MSWCNGNCGDGHEGEKHCILDSQNADSFSEKGVLISFYIYNFKLVKSQYKFIDLQT